MAKELADLNFGAIKEIQEFCYDAAETKGFWEDKKQHHTPESMRSYRGNKLMLVVGEVAEAHEELRKGRTMTETYYDYNGELISSEKYLQLLKDDAAMAILKPEGVPSELVDILVRVFDLAGGEGVDLSAMLYEKLRYNSTRGYKHGKTF